LRHAGLTVTDLDRSVAWYGRVLGLAEAFREQHADRTSAVLRGGPVILGLVRFTTTESPFSPAHVGLDHLCFAVRNRAELEAWAQHLDRCGVRHSGVAEMATGPIVNFSDPDGIALALAVPPPHDSTR
jgi:catechol 2,3-dioxygenase-like lactoylglutathione lyase family enzyme